MRAKWLAYVLTVCLLMACQYGGIVGAQQKDTTEATVNLDGSATSEVKPKGRESIIYKKKFDADAMEREWTKGDEEAELQQEQDYLLKQRKGMKQPGSSTADDAVAAGRIDRIDKDNAFVVPVHAFLKQKNKKGAKYTESDATNLGVKYRQRLMSAGIPVGFELALAKTSKKKKSSGKKMKVTTQIVVVHVDKGWQVKDTIRFLLKQSDVAKVTLDNEEYTQKDLTEEELEDLEDGAVVSQDNDEDDDDDKNTHSQSPRKAAQKTTKKKSDKSGAAGNTKPGEKGKEQPDVSDPLGVNKDPSGFGNQIYVELKKVKETRKDKAVGWTIPEADKLAEKWKQLVRTAYPGTEVTNMGPIGPPPSVPVGDPIPPRTEEPGMTLIIKVEKAWMTYDLLKFALTQPETDKATVHSRTLTRKDLPAEDEDD